MAVSIVGYETGSGTGTGNVTVNKPSGSATGDTLYAFMLTGDTVNDYFTLPSGWTSVLAVDTGSYYMRIYRRTLDGSEGSSFAFTPNEYLGGGRVTIVCVRGSDTAGDVTASSWSSGGSGSSTSPTITPSAADSLVLRCIAHIRSDHDVTSVADCTIGYETTTGTCFTGIASQSASGATGTKAVAYTPSWHEAEHHMVLALAPAAAGSAPLPVFQRHYRQQGIA